MRNLSRAIRSLGLVLATIVPAQMSVPANTGQIVHGTVAILEVSRERVVIAVDSRAKMVMDGEAHDDVCKMEIFPNGILFVAAGIVEEFNPLRKDLQWSAKDLARRAATEAKPNPLKSRRPLQGVAALWATRLSKKYSQGFKANPDLFYGPGGPAGVLLDAAFIDLDPEGEIEIQEVSFTLSQPLGRESRVIVHQIPLVLTDAFQLMAMGYREIEAEFTALRSSRSQIEQRRWKLGLSHLSALELRTEMVRHLVFWLRSNTRLLKPVWVGRWTSRK